jgi:MFS family permease
MAVEHSPERSRGLNASWPQMGVPAGLVLGTGAFALISSLSGDALLTWGWRVPFLLSVLLIAVYIAAVCALSVVCYALAAETYRKDIYEEEPAERRLVAEQQG